MLQDSLADIENKLEMSEQKQIKLTTKVKSQDQELDKARREQENYRKFAAVLDEAESNSQQYFLTMKEMKANLKS